MTMFKLLKFEKLVSFAYGRGFLKVHIWHEKWINFILY